MHMITSIPSPVPTVSGPSSLDSLDALMGGLKKTIRRRLVTRYRACLPDVLVHRAVDDAEELARSTDLPHLFLPLLAEERLERVWRAVCPEQAQSETRGLSRAA